MTTIISNVTSGRQPKPLPDEPISYPLATNKNTRFTLVCPVCGAAYSYTVTSASKGRQVAKVRFVCGHGDEGREGEFVRALKWGRGK